MPPPPCVLLLLLHGSTCARSMWLTPARPNSHAQATLQQKEAQLTTVWPYSKSYGRSSINTIIGAADAGKSMVGGCGGSRTVCMLACARLCKRAQKPGHMPSAPCGTHKRNHTPCFVRAHARAGGEDAARGWVGEDRA